MVGKYYYCEITVESDLDSFETYEYIINAENENKAKIYAIYRLNNEFLIDLDFEKEFTILITNIYETTGDAQL